MQKTQIIPLDELPGTDLQPLLDESRAQGFELLERLAAEYHDGSNRFSQPGEALFGVYHEDRLVAIGGLNQDPYVPEQERGRVRHVYVLSAWRRRGIGRLLMERIIEEARRHFRVLALRTFTDEADRFYRSIGFRVKHGHAATHTLDLQE